MTVPKKSVWLVTMVMKKAPAGKAHTDQRNRIWNLAQKKVELFTALAKRRSSARRKNQVLSSGWTLQRYVRGNTKNEYAKSSVLAARRVLKLMSHRLPSPRPGPGRLNVLWSVLCGGLPPNGSNGKGVPSPVWRNESTFGWARANSRTWARNYWLSADSGGGGGGWRKRSMQLLVAGRSRASGDTWDL